MDFSKLYEPGTKHDQVYINRINETFIPYNSALAEHAREIIAANHGRVFKVNIGKRYALYEAYLQAFPEATRQEHNCNCCKSFIRRYGNLVVVDPVTGKVSAVLWSAPGISEEYKASVDAVRKLVESCKIEAVYYADPEKDNPKVLGEHQTNGFNHLYIYAVGIQGGRDKTKTAEANIANTRQEAKVFRDNILSYDIKVVAKLAEYFQNSVDMKGYDREQEKIQWLWDFLETYRAAPNATRDGLIWMAVASLGYGKIGIGNSPMGKLIDRLQAGRELEYCIAAYKEMVAPENHMRPTAAPKAGAVDVANKRIVELGLIPSLERRSARLDEVPKFWEKPVKAEEEKPTSDGFFDGLKTSTPKKGDTVMRPDLEAALSVIDGGPMSLRQFEQEVLPTAESLYITLSGYNRYAFGSFNTAVNADAPPLIRWDTEEQRNPFNAWVLAADGSTLGEWGVSASSAALIEVKAILIDAESLFETEATVRNHLFVLEGMKVPLVKSLALFPAVMRPELHEVRSVIEAYSGSHHLVGTEDGFGGLFIGLSDPIVGLIFTVKRKGTTFKYKIDRAY